MDKKGKNKIRFFLFGLRNAVMYAAIIAAILTVIATIVALVKHGAIINSIYMSYYYGGAFVLMVSVPQLYRRNLPGKEKKIGFSDTLFGFYGWNNTSISEEDEEEYKQLMGEGFWLGILILITGILLIALGVITESIFFK